MRELGQDRLKLDPAPGGPAPLLLLDSLRSVRRVDIGFSVYIRIGILQTVSVTDALVTAEQETGQY